MKPMRINRFLASCGLGSRRQCEQWITEGKVTINRQPVSELATTVSKSDLVMFQGKEVRPDSTATVLLHKPPGVLCTKKDPKGRPTIYDLLPPPLQNLHYVGRLDSESEGLLLLTNDGDLTQLLTHPSHSTEKEYWVILNRSFRQEDTAALKAGMMLEEGLAKADKVDIITPRHLSVVLHQGLNRQIRRMFELLNYEVLRLVRIRIGGLDIGQLKPGKFRHLHEPDFIKLHQNSNQPGRAKLPVAYPTHEGAKAPAPKGKRVTPVRAYPAKKAARPFGAPRLLDVPTSFGEKGTSPLRKSSSRPNFKGASERPRTGPAGRPAAPSSGRPAYKRPIDIVSDEDATAFRTDRPAPKSRPTSRRPDRPGRPKAAVGGFGKTDKSGKTGKSGPKKPSAGGRFGKGSGNAKPAKPPRGPRRKS